MTRLWQCQGHGGANLGCDHGGLVERAWVFGMARDLTPALVALGLEVQSARAGNETVGYPDRAILAHNWGADLALCHHVDAALYPAGHARAGEVITYRDGLTCYARAGDPVGLEVGSAIMRAAPKDLRVSKPRCVPTSEHDWTRNADYILRQYGRRGIPGVLIEWGFATSPRDRAILMGPEHRPALIAAAMAGVGRFLELQPPS